MTQPEQVAIDIEKLIGRLVLEHEVTKAKLFTAQKALIDKSNDPVVASEVSSKDSRAQAAGDG